MKIAHVRASKVCTATALGRPIVEPAAWHEAIDHMNPFADDPMFAGQARRFEPRLGELICVVTASDGQFGVGFTSHASVTAPLVNEYLGPMIRGEDPTDPASIWRMMTRAAGSHLGAQGIASYAISAIDLAVWDLFGKVVGAPVYDLIDSRRTRRPLRCYATGLDIDSYRSLGFDAFKVPCPWRSDRQESIAATLALLDRARAQAGEAAALMLDCWAVHSVDDAAAIAEAVAPYGLQWIEDPIYPEDWRGYAELRGRLPGTRLAAGERWHTELPFLTAIDEGWVDVIQPDVQWCGGVSPTLSIAERAATSGVEVALHCAANDAYGQHIAYALNDSIAEMYIGSRPGDPPYEYRSTPGMAMPVDGRLVPTEALGFGIELTLADIEAATR